MKLYAISDLHLRYEENRNALLSMGAYPEDWLIIAGDVGESADQLEFALEVLSTRFARLFWVPGNHDLWTMPSDVTGVRGVAKYNQFVNICRRYGVLTPEDRYVVWRGEGPECLIAPLFLLYDYSFAPAGKRSAKAAVEWALEDDTICSDEVLLHSDPYPSVVEWCEARVQYTEKRLAEAAKMAPLLLINHFPLLEQHAVLWRFPRFKIWCGTQKTADWHRRYPIEAVIYGHLHIRRSHRTDETRFEEVSLGYPKQWRPEKGIDAYLREIFPGQ